MGVALDCLLGTSPLCPSDISPLFRTYLGGGNPPALPPRASTAKVAALIRVPLRCAKGTVYPPCASSTTISRTSWEAMEPMNWLVSASVTGRMVMEFSVIV